MKANNFSSAEFRTIAKNAGSELKTAFKSPFVIQNLLNKMAKGDFSKVAGAEGLTYSSVKLVADAVKRLHNGRYAFDVSIFPKNYRGEFCTATEYKKELSALCVDYVGEDVTAQILTDGRGREVCQMCSDGTDKYFMLSPIALSLTAFLNAFARVAGVAIKAEEKAAAAAQKAADDAKSKAEKKRAREIEKTQKGLISDFNAGRIDEITFFESMRNLKARYIA